MPKGEIAETDTGEQEFPLARKQRRATSPGQSDALAASGDGTFPGDGQRRGATNMGRPMMLPAARRRRGMR